jgi:hypothetical protein
MKLYILRPINGRAEWKPWYDKCFGFVVRAKSEEEARAIAASEAKSEGAGAWLNDEASTCEVLTAKGEAGMVIEDFASA